MSDTRGESGHLRSRQGRRTRRWHWQTAIAALLALLAVEGQPVAASYATVGPSSIAGRAIQAVGRAAAPRATGEGVNQAASRATTAPVSDDRPDFTVAFAHLDEAQAGQPFSYTVQVRNTGSAGSAVSVRTMLPPELSNVRVTAPGFACTRQFWAGGQQPGTLVMCMRNDLDSGGTADVTVEANAPSAVGPFQITATADPRDDVAETDEANNAADATIQVRA